MKNIDFLGNEISLDDRVILIVNQDFKKGTITWMNRIDENLMVEVSDDRNHLHYAPSDKLIKIK